MPFCSTFVLLAVLVGSFLPAGDRPAPTVVTPSTRNLAIFLFEGVQIIDYTGPYEVFGQAYDGASRRPMFNVYTVAKGPGPLTTAMGMTVVPKYTFENCPRPDVLVLPGGGVPRHLDDPEVIAWVRESARGAEHVLSVCNGAFFLGKAGLLDGLSATTYYGLVDELKALAPACRVVTDQRFVDNGKIVTAAGLSSGIDGALHLVEKIAGRGRAQEIALNMEYNWQPDVPYARASFADRFLRKALGHGGFQLPEGTRWTVVGQEGGADRWTKRWDVGGELTAAELAGIVDAKLSGAWMKVATASGAAKTTWKFADEEGRPWRAASTVTPAAGTPGHFLITIELARDGMAVGQR